MGDWRGLEGIGALFTLGRNVASKRDHLHLSYVSLGETPFADTWAAIIHAFRKTSKSCRSENNYIIKRGNVSRYHT